MYPRRSPGSIRFIVVLLVPTIFLFSGCAVLYSQRDVFFRERPADHIEFFKQLDKEVDSAKVRDAAHPLVSGFPYLRTSRFLAQLGKDLDTEQEKKQWVRLMQQLDLSARTKEIRNLPDESIVSLGFTEDGKANRERLFSRLTSASEKLLDHDRASADFYEQLSRAVEVPEVYSTTRRIAGLYPLFAIPVIAGTDRAYKHIKSAFGVPLEAMPVDGELMTYTPKSQDTISAGEVRALIDRSRKNPLRIPLPSNTDAKRLALSFAPVIIQDTVSSYDAIGRIVWKGDRLIVDGEKPTVYYYLSHALLGGEPIFQINYVFWYAARDGENAPWIERGNIDGNTIRISLDNQGEVFMVDIMNTCGCYHFFVPKEDRIDRIVPQRFKLDPFAPQWLPFTDPGERLGFRIISGWHQVRRVINWRRATPGVPYRLAPYHELESLPRGATRFESMFDENGIAKSSTRPREEFLFFSMGIPSVAAMRQRGNHPIVLAGRAYFDDPLLFEKSFEFK